MIARLDLPLILLEGKHSHYESTEKDEETCDSMNPHRDRVVHLQPSSGRNLKQGEQAPAYSEYDAMDNIEIKDIQLIDISCCLDLELHTTVEPVPSLMPRCVRVDIFSINFFEAGIDEVDGLSHFQGLRYVVRCFAFSI